ncbi:DUF1284 domain-containing protein, partial [Mesorhizobium sp. M7A.F.Ca.CA.002.15.1.1]
EPHCLNESVVERDRLAAQDVEELLARPIQVGTCVDLDTAMLGRMRQAFSAGLVRKACGGCEWNELCSTIAAGGYSDTLVQRSASPGKG